MLILKMNVRGLISDTFHLYLLSDLGVARVAVHLQLGM